MANTSNSIEVQIDNFLEHFKRSASKAMDTDWISGEPSPNYTTKSATTAASFNYSSPLKTTKTRSSCFDISQLGSISGKIKNYSNSIKSNVIQNNSHLTKWTKIMRTVVCMEFENENKHEKLIRK